MEQLPETDQEPALSRGGRAETPALGLARGRLESEPDWLYVSFPYAGSWELHVLQVGELEDSVNDFPPDP